MHSQYISTRGQSPALPFSQARWSALIARTPSTAYADIAADLFSLYSFGPQSAFRSIHVAPLHDVRDHTSPNKPLVHILELFHGPTLAFKDVALQFLGYLFEYLLARQPEGKQEVTVVGATSGDTGSAAIAGLRGKAGIRVCILHPHGKVSPVQAAQMTSVLDANVCNVALDGDCTFDDCQDVVKAMFNDPSMRAEFQLAAVNSINFARILAQVSYYVYSYLQLEAQFGRHAVEAKVVYSQMGLPIGKLIVATNENDILYRFMQSGIYSPDPNWQPGMPADTSFQAHPTLSPAMDITVASNFERVLYDWVQDATQVKAWMDQVKTRGGFKVPDSVLHKARTALWSHHVRDSEIVDTIADYYARSKYVLDPHTAVGVRSADEYRAHHVVAGPMVCLATAHPGKFLDAVCTALARSFPQGTSAEVKALETLPRRLVKLQRDNNGAKPGKEQVAKVLRMQWPVGEVVVGQKLVPANCDLV
ncbi:tryptophan synthase beta subunit-like PLP-dependent enzyme [Catenaria anguillulae PL171]|uniref:threonine synthase n=1 Tax=Catenaria anguillulae PL171 TaxID=765915 RepID=A0A1Y2I2A4_9FUNG|nr:tryptophan synthase beta subunit-like PLP-dependent enzyme [Catenaria anguillulae PL171]